MDSWASCHMMRTCDLLTRLLGTDLDLDVELDTHSKCPMKGVRTVRFQLKSRGYLQVIGMFYVLKLRMNLASVLVMEDNGYTISFKRGWIFM